MPTRTLHLTSALLLSSLALPVLAQPHHAAAPMQDGTLLTLSAEARRSVAQDRLSAILAFQAEGATPEAAQAKLNAKMQAAKKIYDVAKDVKVTTGSYQTYEQHQPNPKDAQAEPVKVWVASQQLNLDSAAREALLKLSTQLQAQGFAMQSLNFYLSREASEALRDELTDEALLSIRKRAERMGKTLGMDEVKLVRLNTDGSMPAPQPYPMMRGMAMMAMEKAMDSAVAEAGESEVSVTVSAEVLLKD